MNETEILIEALGQVPELVEAAKVYKTANDKTVSALATAIKQQPNAIIPPTEILKVINAVAGTQCALPDSADLVRKITAEIAPILREEVEQTIRKTRIHLQHEHKHYSLGNLWEIVDDKAQKWIFGLACAVFLLLMGYAFGIAYAFESELFLGREYWEICSSEYLTKEEADAMLEDLDGVSAYPEKYKDYPKSLREKLRKNKSIIKKRRKQAKNNDGKFSAKEKVGF